MHIHFPCWSCGKSLKVKQAYAGRKCRCTGCDNVNSIPGTIDVNAVLDDVEEEEEQEEEDASGQAENTQSGKVFCYKCGSSIYVEAEICPNCGVRQKHPSSGRYGNETRSRIAAALLAFFFGIFGAHHFYVGNKSKGALFLVFGCLIVLFLIPAGLFIPPLFIVGIISCIIIEILSFIEFIMFLAMSDEEFSQKYNN